MTKTLLANPRPSSTTRWRLPPAEAPEMRQSPSGHVSRTVLTTLVDDSESEILRRLKADGYIEDVRGSYRLTLKGKAIGIQKGRQLYFHLQDTVDALDLTIKR